MEVGGKDKMGEKAEIVLNFQVACRSSTLILGGSAGSRVTLCFDVTNYEAAYILCASNSGKLCFLSTAASYRFNC